MLIVEMVRGEPGEAGFATFELQVKSWRKLLEVAEKFGWTSEGTVVDKDSEKEILTTLGVFNRPIRSSLGTIANA